MVFSALFCFTLHHAWQQRSGQIDFSLVRTRSISPSSSNAIVLQNKNRRGSLKSATVCTVQHHCWLKNKSWPRICWDTGCPHLPLQDNMAVSPPIGWNSTSSVLEQLTPLTQKSAALHCWDLEIHLHYYNMWGNITFQKKLLIGTLLWSLVVCRPMVYARVPYAAVFGWKAQQGSPASVCSQNDFSLENMAVVQSL